jgi:uncharacterized membrane protein
MFCSRCGTTFPAGAQFCASCGAAIAPVSVAALPVPWAGPGQFEVRAGEWVSEGWRVVKSDLSSYLLAGLIFCLLGGAASGILQGALIVGLHIFTLRKLLGRPAAVGDIFQGFGYFLPAFLASLVIGLFVALGTICLIIPGLVIAAMYKFTFLFIFDKRMDFWAAMRASHEVARRDYVGFTMFLLLLIGVDILGCLCFVIGLFVAIPVTFAAVTIAYREIVGFEQSTINSI